MKRYTTPTLPITIRMPYDNVKSIEFVFKDSIEEDAPVLLHKEFLSRESIPAEFEEHSDKFIVNMPLTLEDTTKLTTGVVYMDTHIVLINGYVPKTKIVKHIVDPSLFIGVHNND